MLAGAVLLWIFFGFVGCAIGSKKDRAADGFLYGAFLGPLGWCLIAFGPVWTAIFAALVIGIGYGFVRQEQEQDAREEAAKAKQEQIDAQIAAEQQREISPDSEIAPAPTPTPAPGAWMWRNH
jgi:hypothetical protein